MAKSNHYALSVDHLSIQFNGLVVIKDLSFTIPKGQITAIIGPNGAGKTTLFNCITGFYKPNKGTVKTYVDNRLIHLNKLKPHQFANEARIMRTFQNIRLFKEFSVLENLFMAQFNQFNQQTWYGLKAYIRKRDYQQTLDNFYHKAYETLAIFNLHKKVNDLAGSLPYGDQRKLEIARCLINNPSIMCLDEPAAGLNEVEKDQLTDILRSIQRDKDLTVLLIEHHMPMVMGLANSVMVLNYGEKIAFDTPEAIRHNKQVINAYLGDS